MPKYHITAIVPCFNHGQYIKDCLNGFINQTIKPNVICIIDDCSTDDSFEKIRQVIPQIKGLQGIEVKLLQTPKNSGRAASCNVGLKATKTDIIALCDADDVYLPTKIEESLKAFDIFGNVAVAYTDLIGWDTRENPPKETIDYFRSWNYDYHLRRNVVMGAAIVRRPIYDLVGLYDEEMWVAEDYDMWTRIAEKAMFWHIPKPLYKYRQHGQNLTANVQRDRDKWNFALRRIHEKRIQRLKRA